MINITSMDLEKLTKINSGTFGTIYKNNDENTIYKIYRLKVPQDYTKIEMDNPTLKLSKARYNRLIRRSKKLKYSDGIIDTVNVNGRFQGVIEVPREDETLYDKQDLPLSKRIDLSRKMVRNAKELTSHLIYPDDYKLNNIIYSDDELYFIDLDDRRTHVSIYPSLFFRALSIDSLACTIVNFIEQGQRYVCESLKVNRKLERKDYFLYITYHQINKYLDAISKPKDILFIKEDDDMSTIKELQDKHDFKVIRVFNDICTTPEKELEVLLDYDDNYIKLYDFVHNQKMDDYKNIDTVNEEYVLENKILKRVYKR